MNPANENAMHVWYRRQVWLLCFATFVLPDVLIAAGPISFDREIAALFVRRCLDCHNRTERKGGLDLSRVDSATKGGDSGTVIVANKAADSLLWQRVRDGEMPPKKPLPKDEVELLRRWIDGGAKWGTSPIDPFAITTANRAGYDWWSLQPVKRPAAPEIRNPKSDIRNEIDRFVLARLERNELSPSPPADKRTLIRRRSFDLIGLPPTPEEVSEFENDNSPRADEKLVDRLLDSPHFGERWARHWLDVIRFGESQGFERDKLRTNSWRYRDWVVNAFNCDMPYDEFVRLQLAGDVLKPGEADALIATGFLVAGAYDEVGQVQQSLAMRAVVRQDEMEDYVSTIGETFLGLTVHCARCHDHKFDPVSQRDYYSLAAALAGVRHGERELPANSGQPAADTESHRAALQRELDSLAARLSAIDAEPRTAILAERAARVVSKQKPPQPLARWEFNGDLQDSIGELHGKVNNGGRFEDGALRLDGQRTFAATVPLKSSLRAKTLEAWVRLDNLKQQGGAAISVQAPDGATFDALVFGEREPSRWVAGSNFYERTQSFQGAEETEADKKLVHVAIVYDADGRITGYRNGVPYGSSYKSSGPVTFEAGKSQIVFGLRHSPPGGNKHLAGWLDRAAVYDRALSADEIAAAFGTLSDYVSESELIARLSRDQQMERSRIAFEIDHLRKQLARANDAKVYCVAPKTPEPTFLLLRGNPATRADELSVTSLAVGTKSPAADGQWQFQLAKDASDAERRIALAKWLTDTRNPLLPRVIVNRLWQYHFGVGLVDSPSDFGFSGGRPSHPELLDWLAAELMEPTASSEGKSPPPSALRPPPWSLKHIHRLIVTSAAYRQSSRPRVDAAQMDAGNRLLWRKSPARLEAETVRDALLAVSGELNPAIGGPGYHDFTTFTFNSQFYDIVDPIGASFQRRSVYRTWVRSGRNPFLEVLDCPDPSTKTPKRAVTTTPLQALALLNNSFLLRMSDRIAERTRREAGDDINQQIERMLRLTLGRAPRADEAAEFRAFVGEHGLPSLARVLFNSNEFLIVE